MEEDEIYGLSLSFICVMIRVEKLFSKVCKKKSFFKDTLSINLITILHALIEELDEIDKTIMNQKYVLYKKLWFLLKISLLLLKIRKIMMTKTLNR